MVDGDKTDLHEEDKGGENEGKEAEGKEVEGIDGEGNEAERKEGECSEDCKRNSVGEKELTLQTPHIWSPFSLLDYEHCAGSNHGFCSRLSGSCYGYRDSKKAGRSS